MKRFKRAEVAIVALTLAFIFFTAGYFTGRRGSVNIVTIAAPEVTAMAAPPQTAPPRESAQTGPAESPAREEREPGADEYTLSDDPSDVLGDISYDLPNADALVEQNANGEEPVPGAPRGGNHRVININTASRAELTDLHGIGDVLAGRIIEYRNQAGSFGRIEDIMNVSGIGPARFEAIRDRITV